MGTEYLPPPKTDRWGGDVNPWSRSTYVTEYGFCVNCGGRFYPTPNGDLCCVRCGDSVLKMYAQEYIDLYGTEGLYIKD